MTVTVLGLPRPLTDADLTAVGSADLLVGGRRQLALLAAAGGTSAAERLLVAGDLGPVLDRVARADRPCVVASGDPGWFGIVRLLADRVGADQLDVRPAPSSVSLAFAAIGLSWEDALVVSAHGRDPRPALAACRRHPKVAVLTGPDCGPEAIAAATADLDRRVVVAADLGGPDEQVGDHDPGRTWPDPTVVLVLDRAVLDPTRPVGPKAHRQGPPLPRTAGLPEGDFDHRDGMITKAEVRAIAIGWLGPASGVHLWDVGAGSGSVAVEASRQGAAVWAVERDPDQCARIAANAHRHDAPVTVVAGQAPGALDGLPDPDAAFVGGGGTEVVAAVARRVRQTVVVALAALERIGPAWAVLAEAGLAVDGTQIAASRLAALPDGSHRLAAANPVTLLRGTRPPASETL